MRWIVYWSLLVASVKMFVRNRAALFFSLVVPLLIMLIFGVLKFGGPVTVGLGLVDEAGNADSHALVAVLKANASFAVYQGTRSGELSELKTGHRDLVLVIGPGYDRQHPGAPGLVAYTNAARPEQAQLGALLLNAVVGQMLAGSGSSGSALVATQQLAGRDYGYIDFLVPGIIGLTVMQLGLFSVSFGFVQLKRTGALRRLFATPTSPAYFLAAQVTSRILICLAQVMVLLGVGLWFGLHLVGSIALLLAVATLGSVIFLALGFGIAGWAKNEDQAAPVANLVSLPMTFLSGVFFSRDAMPDLLRTITDYLPLTYLNDALRRITNDGVGITQIGGDLLGMGAWAAIAFALAVILFRWE
jgi:ABC-2 type transport system permease protein